MITYKMLFYIKYIEYTPNYLSTNITNYYIRHVQYYLHYKMLHKIIELLTRKNYAILHTLSLTIRYITPLTIHYVALLTYNNYAILLTCTRLQNNAQLVFGKTVITNLNLAN